jgi:hypothetical protein
MRRTPPSFQPGPLSRAQAEALNQLARDLYNSLLGHFTAIPPLECKQGQEGVSYRMGPAAVGGVILRKNSGTPDYGPRRRINLIEGTNIIIGEVDDPANDEVDVTITASLGAGADPACYPSYGAALDASQNDWNPSALHWWRLTRGASPANVDITGIIAGGDGCPILITHSGLTGGGATANTITLKGSSTASGANNRFLPAADVVLSDGDSVLVRYDPVLARHRMVRYPAVTLTQAGIVSLADQTLGAGKKTVPDKFGVGLAATGSLLANSAIDVRGYTYSYFAGIISFGGGNTPTSESDGALLQYAGGGSPALTLSFAAAGYTAGTVGGCIMQGSRFVLRHKTATPKYAFYNDDTSAYTDGATGTVNGLTFVGGLYTSGAGLTGGGGITIGGGTVTNTGVTSIIAGTGISVSGATGDVTVSLVTPVAIASGGTNSTTALSNNRIMVSAGGAIVEAAALTNGQLLIGSTGAAPVAAAITDGAGNTANDGSGIVITNSAGGIKVTTSGGAGNFTVHSGAAINAAGTTQAAAAAITTDTVTATTATSQTGIRLPATPGYARIFIRALGTAVLSIYPPTGGVINALAANAATTLASGSQIEAWSTSATNLQWYTR